MAYQTLFCPHAGNCQIYQAIPTNPSFQSKPDVIESSPKGYSCIAFRTASELKDRSTGAECTHITLLNLLPSPKVNKR